MAYMTIAVTSQSTIAATPAARNRALRVAFTWIGDAWHKLYKMLKFTNAATNKYGLHPRMGEPGSGRPFKGSYTQAKLKRRRNGQGVQAIGETKPFVWSGKSRSDAKASRKVVATAARGFGKADCIINAPTLNLTPKGGRIKQREEFERVTDEERRHLEGEGILIYEIELLSKKGERNVFTA
jgi:hypothetical protein